LPTARSPSWLALWCHHRACENGVKEKITRYRRECFRRLWDAFKHDILPAADLAPRPTGQSGAALAYELATAVANLAREQMGAERRLGGRIDNMGRWAKRIDERIIALELRLAEDDEKSR
jgi:hypothetical protein